MTVRLPDQLQTEIEAEARERKCAKSDVVRDRLSSSSRLKLVADLIGSVDGLPADLSGNKKRYLKTMGYGKKRTR
jgi:hypothetical protein